MEEQKEKVEVASAETGAEGRFGQAKAFVNEKVDAASKAAKEKYSAAADAAKEKYTAASDAVKEKIGAVRQKVDDVDFDELKGQATEYVRKNPVQALAISLGVGFLLGFLLRRATRDDD